MKTRMLLCLLASTLVVPASAYAKSRHPRTTSSCETSCGKRANDCLMTCTDKNTQQACTKKCTSQAVACSNGCNKKH